MSLLVISFLTNNMNQQGNKGYAMPSMQNIQEIMDLFERMNKVSYNMNKNHSRNGGKKTLNNVNKWQNESYEEDLIAKIRNFLSRLNGD